MSKWAVEVGYSLTERETLRKSSFSSAPMSFGTLVFAAEGALRTRLRLGPGLIQRCGAFLNFWDLAATEAHPTTTTTTETGLCTIL